MRLRQGIVIQQQQQKYCETKMQTVQKKKLIWRYGGTSTIGPVFDPDVFENVPNVLLGNCVIRYCKI